MWAMSCVSARRHSATPRSFENSKVLTRKEQEVEEVGVQKRTEEETEKDQMKHTDDAEAVCKHITITTFNKR